MKMQVFDVEIWNDNDHTFQIEATISPEYIEGCNGRIIGCDLIVESAKLVFGSRKREVIDLLTEYQVEHIIEQANKQMEQAYRDHLDDVAYDRYMEEQYA